MIAIINYRAANLHNLKNALDEIGEDAKIFDSAQGLENAEKIILPGVGSFGFCCENLEKYGFVESVLSASKSGKPILGICVGMQLLFSGSEENPEFKGLNLIEGQVKKFSNKLKVPQIGWNSISHNSDPIFRNVAQDSWFYFVHSFYCFPENSEFVIGRTEYSNTFASIVRKDSLYGFQFHPEKSHNNGLQLLKNFCEKC